MKFVRRWMQGLHEQDARFMLQSNKEDPFSEPPRVDAVGVIRGGSRMNPYLLDLDMKAP